MTHTTWICEHFYFIKTHRSHFNLIGYHDNDSGTLLPDHFPEIKHRYWQASLCGYVSSPWPGYLTINIVCIDVVRALDTGVWLLEDNTCMVICECVACDISDFSTSVTCATWSISVAGLWSVQTPIWPWLYLSNVPIMHEYCILLNFWGCKLLWIAIFKDFSFNNFANLLHPHIYRHSIQAPTHRRCASKAMPTCKILPYAIYLVHQMIKQYGIRSPSL